MFPYQSRNKIKLSFLGRDKRVNRKKKLIRQQSQLIIQGKKKQILIILGGLQFGPDSNNTQ